jgi:hypothetical protein
MCVCVRMYVPDRICVRIHHHDRWLRPGCGVRDATPHMIRPTLGRVGDEERWGKESEE